MTTPHTIEHMVWVLDHNYNVLGTLSALTSDTEEPTGWAVAIRPSSVEEHRLWDYTDLGRCTDRTEGIQTVRQHASIKRGQPMNEEGETG